MIEMDQSTIADEVESRLTDIFGDADSAPAPGKGDDATGGALLELKATVLSLDWEITDEVVGRLIAEAQGIKGAYHQDRHVQTCSQILISLGKYMRVYKGRSHPDTVRLINSAFACLEKIIQQNVLNTPEKNRLVFKEIEAFKRLKGEIVKRRQNASNARHQEAQGQGPVPKPVKKPEPGRISEMPLHAEAKGPLPPPGTDAPSRIVAELREMIRAEFDALRADLKSLIGARPS